jgi:hypothetical protein
MVMQVEATNIKFLLCIGSMCKRPSRFLSLTCLTIYTLLHIALTILLILREQTFITIYSLALCSLDILAVLYACFALVTNQFARVYVANLSFQILIVIEIVHCLILGALELFSPEIAKIYNDMSIDVGAVYASIVLFGFINGYLYFNYAKGMAVSPILNEHLFFEEGSENYIITFIQNDYGQITPQLVKNSFASKSLVSNDLARSDVERSFITQASSQY